MLGMDGEVSGTAVPPRSGPSLGGDHGRLVGFFVAGAFLVGEEGGSASASQRCRRRSCRQVRSPASAAAPEASRRCQAAFRLLRHLRLLQVIDELRRVLALRLAHRLKDAALRDAAEIIVDRSASSRPRPCPAQPRARAGRPGRGGARARTARRPCRHSGRPSRRGR